MNVETFHLKLLGANPSQTPEPYRLTPQLRDFYKQGGRGFDCSKQCGDKFLGVFTMALALTETMYPVYILVKDPDQFRWIFDQIESITRHIFRTRKGQSREILRPLRNAIDQLRTSHEVTLRADEPRRWVMFGFSLQDPQLPSWAKGHLVPVSEDAGVKKHL